MSETAKTFHGCFSFALVFYFKYVTAEKNTVQYQFYFSYAGTIIRRLCRPTIPSLQSAKLVNWLIYIYISLFASKNADKQTERDSKN